MKKLMLLIAGVMETRRKALIQFQPGIEEARKDLYHKFYESRGERISDWITDIIFWRIN